MVSGDEGGVGEPEMAVGCRGGCARRRRAERWWSWRSWWWTKDNSTTGLGVGSRSPLAASCVAVGGKLDGRGKRLPSAKSQNPDSTPLTCTTSRERERDELPLLLHAQQI